MTRKVRSSRLLAAVTGLAFLASALSGCGQSSEASVSGRVLYRGEPLAGGRVTFIGPNDVIAVATIEEDGRYSFAKAPVGEVKIGVTPPAIAPTMPGGRKMDPSTMGGGAEKPATPKPIKRVTIPSQYRDPDKSGLTYTVQTGSQEHDIVLK